MGDLKKVQSGAPLVIPAGTYNAFIDAAADYQARTVNFGQQTAPSFMQASIVLVRNDSGSDQPRMAVLGVSAPIIGPAVNEEEFKKRVAFSCVTPAADNHEGKFVILAEPLAIGKIGRAYAAGVCPVKIDVPDEDEEWRYADVVDGDTTKLEVSKKGAATILWREGGTGEQWAIIRLGRYHEDEADILFGRNVAPWYGGETIELDPCDVAGVDNGDPNVIATIMPEAYTMTNGTYIAAGTIVPYVLSDAGDPYVLGIPVQVVTEYEIDADTFKFLKKTRNVWVLTTGIESDWLEVHIGTSCE